MTYNRNKRAIFFATVFATALGTVDVLPAVAAPPVVNRNIRVVDCDAPVQSRKRGVCANHLEPADFVALAPGVSWWYGWHFTTTDKKPKTVPMEFLPMVWGDSPDSEKGLVAYLAKGNRPRRILAINEPNLKGQAFITPERTATTYARVKAIADRYHIPVIGPHMALGSAPSDSIVATDPLEKKEVTYTFMVPFLKAFFSYAKDTPVVATAFHAYGPVGEMRWAVGLTEKEFRRPIWVTEYSHGSTPAESLTYLMQSTDFLERTPMVEGYAWFKERGDASFTASLLQPTDGKLTPLGAAYVAMPVHDPDLYYRMPGRLQAEKYVRMQGLEIWPTTDTSGFAQMTSEKPHAILHYNVQIGKPGTYRVRLRSTGKSGVVTIQQMPRSALTVVTVGESTGWQTVETRIPLNAGKQTIRVELENSGQTLNWIELQAL